MSRSARMLSSSCCSSSSDVAHSLGEWVPLDDVISCSGRVFTAWDLVSTNGEAERGTEMSILSQVNCGCKKCEFSCK